MKRYVLTTAAFLCVLTPSAIAAPANNAPAAATAAVTWMGLSLGEPEADVLLKAGETGFIDPEPAIGPMTSIAYNIDRAAGLLDVSFHAGRVASIGIRRSVRDGGAPSASDPHGITLAMSRSDVTAKLGKGAITSGYGRDTYTYKLPNGLTWRYSFMGDAMQWLSVELSDAALDAMPATPIVTLHTGSSFDDALVDGAADEASGIANERDYLLEQHCPRGHWWETQQALVTNATRQFDVLTLACADGTTKKLYIDITSFFGKL